MKNKMLLSFGFALSLSAVNAFAAGITLAPGGTTTTPLTDNGNLSSQGTLIYTSSPITWNGPYPGESVSAVVEIYKTSTGTLDFDYQFTNTSSSSFSYNLLNEGNFAGFTTAVAYDDNGCGTCVAPNGNGGNTASRDTSGTTVNFYYSGTKILPGQTSDWLEVDTNAPAFSTTGGVLGVTDGGAFSSSAVAPTPSVPEPITMGLLGGGLAFLGVMRVRKSRKS